MCHNEALTLDHRAQARQAGERKERGKCTHFAPSSATKSRKTFQFPRWRSSTADHAQLAGLEPVAANARLACEHETCWPACTLTLAM